MIREYIIVLTSKQEKELIKRSEAAGEEDDLQYLQTQIFNWLKSDSKEGIANALSKEISDKARLSHKEN